MWLTPLEEPTTSLKFSRASKCQSLQMVQEGKKSSMHKHFLKIFVRRSSLICENISCANFYHKQIACASILLSYKTNNRICTIFSALDGSVERDRHFSVTASYMLEPLWVFWLSLWKDMCKFNLIITYC